MKSIKKYVVESNINSMKKLVQEHLETPVYDFDNFNTIDESLRDVLNIQKLKSKFQKVWNWMKNVVVKLGNYFVVPVNKEGQPEPVILPPTMGFAYKAGVINKDNTFIHLNNESAAISGLKNKISDVFKLPVYTKYKTKMDYLKACAANLREASDKHIANICEVKLEADDPNGLKVCDTKTLKTLIKQAWRTRGQAGRLCIWGAPGIGKTAIIQAAMKEIDPNASIIVKTLANETGESFSLPDYVLDEESGLKTGAHDVLKTWLPMYKISGNVEIDAQRDAKLGVGLLFVDELSRANPQAKNVILPIINEGVWEGYKLGSGWCIVAASNRLEDDPNENFANGMALMNRFKHVYYQPSVNVWKEWAEKQGFMSPLLLQWLSLPESENMSGGKYFYYDPNPDLEQSDSGSVVMCTPRSWTKAMIELADIAQNDLNIDAPLSDFKTILNIPPDIMRIALGGNVTTDACEAFIAFLQVINSIGDFDRAVESVWTNGGKSINISAKNMQLVQLPLAQLIITSHPELPTTEEMNSLANFLVTKGNDQITSYIIDIIKNTYLSLINNNEMKEIAFVIHNVLTDKNIKASQKNYVIDVFEPVIKKYGIKDINNFPDYREFIKITGKKYGAILKDVTLDGKTGLV